MPEWHFAKDVLMVTRFRVGRMAQEHGPQKVWIEMDLEIGKTLPIVCSVEHALELADLLEDEATRQCRKDAPKASRSRRGYAKANRL
jgi:hypothetical protein